MANEFVIKNGFQSRGNGQVTGSLDVTGGITGSFTGSFTGDGSGLSGVPATAFPFVGDAVITGSLTVSGSFNAFRVNTSDIILGEDAGASINANTTQYNVVIGKESANTMTLGDYNVFAGYQSARYGLNPQNNVAIGRYAGYAIGASQQSVFIGYRSGYANGTTSTGLTHDFNVGVGGFTLNAISSGDYNTAIGYGALSSTNTGQGNIGIGRSAGSLQTTGTGNITIGSGSLGVAGESNQLRIGHADLAVISASLTTGDIIFASTASAEYFAGDGSQLTNLQRSISSSVSTDITASNSNAGFYFRVGGNVTCSIQTSSLVSCAVGSEFEFFQTSSAGNMLFLSGSGVTLNSKSGNITLTGQFSAATLKKVDTDEWDLIGDLS